MPKPRIARVAVMTAPNTPLEIREVPIPELHAGQVLVRVACCTLCGSDLHTWNGRRPAPLPTILGHEAVGVIAQLGPGRNQDAAGAPLAIGDRIVWTIHNACGQCDYCCERDLPMKCRSLRKFGHEPSDMPPYLVGGLADHAVVEAGMALFRIPVQVPNEVAAPAMCAGATAIAACEAAAIKAGQSLLILGAGALGLYAAAYAAHLGCTSIIVTDLSDERLQVVSRFGATATVGVRKGSESLREAIHHATDGQGVDHVIEAAGTAQAASDALELIRVGGSLVTCGCVFPGATAPLDYSRLTRNRLTVRGIHNYDRSHLKRALDLLQATAARHPWQSLVQQNFSLTNVNDALYASTNGKSLRVSVCCSVS